MKKNKREKNISIIFKKGFKELPNRKIDNLNKQLLELDFKDDKHFLELF
jgi:hypothetical protein